MTHIAFRTRPGVRFGSGILRVGRCQRLASRADPVVNSRVGSYT